MTVAEWERYRAEQVKWLSVFEQGQQLRPKCWLLWDAVGSAVALSDALCFADDRCAEEYTEQCYSVFGRSTAWRWR